MSAVCIMGLKPLAHRRNPQTPKKHASFLQYINASLMLQVARKRPAVPASTPASAAAAGTSGAASRAPPSSAGHTPMDRFGCGPKATPLQAPRFSSLTPPSGVKGTLSEAPTPDLSGFKSGRPSSAGPGFTPGSEADVTPGARGGGSVTPHTPFTPDTAAKAALQGKLDMTPAAGAGKPGVLRILNCTGLCSWLVQRLVLVVPGPHADAQRGLQ